ncbi:hypothetical protein N2152v2_002693 [Parachlorella kessleri]
MVHSYKKEVDGKGPFPNRQTTVRPGRIELAKDQDALIIHFETQELAVGVDGQERLLGTKQGYKRVRLPLNPGANLQQLAQEVLAANKLIHPSKAGEVELLLQQALDRSAGDESDRQQLWQRQQTYMHSTRVAYIPSTAIAAPVTMDRLEEYIEALYKDDMATKVAASASIAQHFRESSNFSDLQLHPTLLQTLSRLLRDDYKHSSELCLNLVCIFFSLSHFLQFHPILVQNQIGSLTLEIMDLEMRRCEHWEQREGLSAADICSKQLHQEMLNPKEQRLAGLLAQQEPLLYSCTYLLLNMAEDQTVEQKMLRKNLLSYLVVMLSRANVELLVLVTTFLRKLSIYEENKQRMEEAGLIQRLAVLVPMESQGTVDVLLASVLRLLHNLAFDEEQRLQMVNCGLIPKAVGLIRRVAGKVQPLVLGLLYHLSMEDKYRSMFLYTDALSTLQQMVLSCQGGLQAYPELAALVINLTQNSRVAEELARGGRIEQLLQRGLQGRDPLLWKVLRNISQHDSIAVKVKFAGSMPAIVKLLVECETTPDMFLEVLGCLANLDIPGYDYEALLTTTHLHEVLGRHATAAATPDDVLLEVVMATGVLCTDATAALLVEAGLVDALYGMMLQRMEDEEFVLQTAATSHALLSAAASRAALLGHPEVVARFTELLQHANREVVRAADRALDAISDLSEEWEASIRRLKFEQHNREWLNMVAMESELAGGAGAESSNDQMGADMSSGAGGGSGMGDGQGMLGDGGEMVGNLYDASDIVAEAAGM